MRHFHVVGIGAGDPRQITIAAAEALASVCCVLSIDKGERCVDLRTVRNRILAVHAPHVPVIEIPDPPRNRRPADYTVEVRRWHRERARRIDEAVRNHVPQEDHAAFLVWGDPSLYDSTLRILAQVATPHDLTVYPGVTAIQTLAAAHEIPLNRIGEPIHVTTGRQLTATLPVNRRNCVVMLDAGHGWLDVATEHTVIYWGAYLGMPQQTLAAGRVQDIGEKLAQLKKRLRESNGWIMDTYILREEDPCGDR